MKIFFPVSISYLLIMTISLMMAGFPFRVQANTVSIISGFILDREKKAMDYASVSLLSAKDSSLIKGTLIDELGKV
ncbi:MAG: hypothetical protein ACOH2A_14135 [Sphingobacteriaceae bacterium]